MEDNLFQTPAQIMKLETMSDGGIRIVMDTQEITNPEDLSKLFRLKKNAVGWLLFKPTELVKEDIPEYDPASFEEEKTPSQRLRAVMYVYHKQVLKRPDSEFDGYYRKYYEDRISSFKEKLPPRIEE